QVQVPMRKGYYGGGDTRKRQAIYWHPGFAWAIRREAFDKLGGLIDWAILGSGDYHMARALVGDAASTIHDGISKRYAYKVLNWQHRAEKFIRRNVGYVPGLLLHNWHGREKDRRYWDRWNMLVRNGFDPDLDLKRDW